MRKTLITHKDYFVDFAKNHTLEEIAKEFNLDKKYTKNYLGNHKIPYAHSDIWHGMSNTRLYTIYRGMLARCYNVKHIHYNLYGGRGIKVCDLWKNDKKEFFNWALNNGYEDNLQIDRIDSNGDYEPENCRFVTNLQNQNNRRCTKLYKGVPIGLIVANKECNPLGQTQVLIYKRVTGDNGRRTKWDIVKALSTKVSGIKGSNKVCKTDKNIECAVKIALAKYFPEVLK